MPTTEGAGRKANAQTVFFLQLSHEKQGTSALAAVFLTHTTIRK